MIDDARPSKAQAGNIERKKWGEKNTQSVINGLITSFFLLLLFLIRIIRRVLCNALRLVFSSCLPSTPNAPKSLNGLIKYKKGKEEQIGSPEGLFHAD